MNKKLKNKMLKKVNPRSIKWLFGGDVPRGYFYIYEGLPEDFILYFEKEILKSEKWDSLYDSYREQTYLDHLIYKWKNIIVWIKEFQSLIKKPFRKKHTQCMVETRQEFEDFTKDDILILIESFGKAAKLLYSASRDVFYSCPTLNRPKFEPLNLYYQYSLEYLMWNFATFVQDKKTCDFMDLYSKLKKELEITK